MGNPFAAAESRVNKAVMSRLSNAEARIETSALGVIVVSGIFDNEYGAAFDGFVGSQQPTFICKTDDLSAGIQGQLCTINDVAYEITNIEPDGVGMTTLRLRKT